MKISQLLLVLLLSLLLIHEDVADPIPAPTPQIPGVSSVTTITIVSSSSVVTVTSTSTTFEPTSSPRPPPPPPLTTSISSNDQNEANGNTSNGNNGTGNTTKTFIIAGAVVAGVIVIGGLFMVVHRFRKTRMDWDEDGEIDLRGDSAWEYSISQYHQRT